MSESEISTVPNTPSPSDDDIASTDIDNVFAWLRPHSHTACAAFNTVVDTLILKPAKYQHVRQFVYTNGRISRAQSTFTEDGGETQPYPCQWQGAFKFALNILPRDPSNGWSLGTNRGRDEEEVDILLAPSSKTWISTGIAGRHARLFFHPDSCRMILQARHSVTTTKNGASVLSRSKTGVLEHGELLEIGTCSYIFEYTALHKAPAFERDLCRYMKEHHREPHWSLNKYLSPTSVGMPISVGKYYSSARAFAQGTFGKVSAGWAPDGSAVAIKSFKNPVKEEIDTLIQIMQRIGHHPNILQLLDYDCSFETEVPDAYCIFAPLATASLTRIIGVYELNVPAILSLFLDYLKGLSFLHSVGIMHRDIGPNNLVVTSLDNPTGVIIDLDSATTDELSTDHMRGTIPFLAPEIIALKTDRSLPPFGRTVDGWALGLSVYALIQDQVFKWNSFRRKGWATSEVVTAQLHTEFHTRIMERQKMEKSPRLGLCLFLIQKMTQFHPSARPSVSKVLSLVSENLVEGSSKITLKSNRKRPRDT